MSKPTDDLIRIASAGGGMYVSSSKPTDDLVRIASAASASGKGAQIIVSGATRKPTDDLIRIASAGNGCVVFDFSP